MALFLSTFTNKVDKKGRVSVPAPFRAAIENLPFKGIVVYPSYKLPCLEGCGIDRMEDMAASLDDLEMFSDEQDELATIFADAHQLPFDGEGRIILSSDLVSISGITDQARFVGRGPTFQIWEPGAFEGHHGEVRARARAKGRTLKVRRQGDSS